MTKRKTKPKRTAKQDAASMNRALRHLEGFFEDMAFFEKVTRNLKRKKKS